MRISVFAFVLSCYISSFAQNVFENVAKGDGRFLTGIIEHKTTGNIYFRTDVGGTYR